MKEPVLRFMACSDLHFRESADVIEKIRFEKGIELLYKYAKTQKYKNVDAIYIVGDFADRGEMAQMKNVKDSIDRCVRPETKVVLSMGSHEYFGKGKETGGRKRFTTVFNQPDNTHFVINGFHFIAVTTTKGCRFQDKQKKFISKELAKAHEDTPFKPIFFFQHPHIKDTIYGSIDWGEDDISSILFNYPQIIDFSGHSHAPVNDPRNIHQDFITTVGTGTVSYFELDEFDKIYGTIPTNHKQAAQMIIVEAYEDGSVVIKPFDILTEKFFDQEWTIEKPWDPSSFEYTREKRIRAAAKPKFDKKAKIDFEKKGKNLTITFDQATCKDERVNDYVITITDDKGAVERRFSIWSEYYLNDMPERIGYTIPAPKAGKYTVSIKARGFWYNSSVNTLDGEFEI